MDKVRQLKVPVSTGRRFVLVVDKKPVMNGYFWNSLSSFSCGETVISVNYPNKLSIEMGCPDKDFAKSNADERANALLLKAFEQTGRLVMIPKE